MKLIVYFADAFAWQYVQRRPFMDGFFTQERPLETILGYSSTVMPAILTGRPPVQTGIWTEYYLSARPRTALERLMSRPRLGWALPIVNLARLVQFRIARGLRMPAEHRLRTPIQLAHLFARHPLAYDKFPPIGLPGPTLPDLFEQRGLRVDFRYLPKGIDPDAELEHVRRNPDVDVFYYYDPSLDARGHHVGASEIELGPQLDAIASFLASATQLLSELGECEVLVFSDHGMTDVGSVFDLHPALAPFTLGEDYLVFIDSTFARFWFADEARRAAVLAALGDAPGSFLTREELERYGVGFPDNRYGDEILAADEGVVFHPSYFAANLFRTKHYPQRGTHGYRPEFASSDGVVLYRGCGLGRELPARVPAVDVFGIVQELVENGAPAQRPARSVSVGEGAG